MTANRNSITVSRRERPTLSRRKGSVRKRGEDRIFHYLLPLIRESELAPGGSRDWGNLILSDGGLLGSPYENAY
jgi:hypothetical protein